LALSILHGIDVNVFQERVLPTHTLKLLTPMIAQFLRIFTPTEYVPAAENIFLNQTSPCVVLVVSPRFHSIASGPPILEGENEISKGISPPILSTLI